MGDEFVTYFSHFSQLGAAENDYISRLNGRIDDPTNSNGAIWLPPDDSIPGRFGNFVAVFGHVRGRSVEPQNPGQNPMDTTSTENLLTEDCVHFLNAILAELKDPYSYNFRSILRKAKAQGPLYTRHMTAEEKKKALGGAHSRVGAPDFYIFLDEGSYAKDPFLLIHEIFHTAAGSGTSYSHTEMAMAAYNAALADPVFKKHMARHGGFIPKQVDYTRPPRDIEADDWYNAGVFDRIAKIGCGTRPTDYP
jgi:hypothetical protein